MRTIVYICLIFVTTAASAQEPEVASNKIERKAQSANSKIQSSLPLIQVFRLKHAKASLVRETLAHLELDAKITEDSRLNSLIVQAEKEVIERIAKILEVVDVIHQESETTIVPASGLQTKSGSDLVQNVAKIVGVEVAFDEGLGIFMIKGPQAEVDRVREVIAQVGEVNAKLKAKAGIVESRALRVLWLSNEPTESRINQVEPDAALKKSIEKLAELGFTNMQVKMQLLGRCDIIDNNAACVVEGTLLTGNIRRTMNLEANLSTQEGSNALNGKIRITGGATPPNIDGEPEKSNVEVAIKLEPKKYYILSAAPVGGYQTAFVVQLIDEL